MRHVTLALASVGATMLTVIAPPPASATAIGTDCRTTWSKVLGRDVPTGTRCLDYSLYGNGLTATEQVSHFHSTTQVCNWRIDWLYFDTNGRRYHTNYGPTRMSCERKGMRALRRPVHLKAGMACAKLVINNREEGHWEGKTSVKQCFAINP